MNKSYITNFVAVLLIATSLLPLNEFSKPLLYAGLFALSGAITNQLAIHMLFEKVPFLYGSGIIQKRFEAFKEAIKSLMMTQFFTKEQLEEFFEAEEKKINLAPVVESTDFTPAFDALSKTVMESSLGGMLNMFGGESALEQLRDPFSNKMKKAVVKIVQSEAFETQLSHHIQHSSLSADLISSIEEVIQKRLDELTPIMIKEMVHNLMKEHLGWLVVWGGIFGGLIGLVSSFLL
ncbi:MAG: DUF445 domain-containing protein [Campylobacterota bacterium]|nr:DUF445 domain-containing protein [Campylobacterota bacterium]